MNDPIKEKDPEIFEILKKEENRQRYTLDMMASESMQDEVSLALSAGAFANKTAVGLPGKQRLLGAQNIDGLEKLAAKRACELFGAEHANILPYSGTVANLCVYDGLLNPGDKILALDPEHGSHASHGRKAHISSRIYNFVHFGVDKDTQLIDYDKLRIIAQREKPKMLLIGSSSYPRLFDYELLAEIAHGVGAVFMTDIAHTTGLVAAKAIPSPVPFADVVTASCTKTMCSAHTGFILCKKEFAHKVDKGAYPGVLASMHPQTIAAAAWAFRKAQSEEFKNLMEQLLKNTRALINELKNRGLSLLTDGSDCHMFVLDLRNTKTNGVKLGEDLGKAGIWVNSKAIPFDQSETPMGIRAGCTVLTQRGMKEKDMAKIADIILTAINFGEKTPTDKDISPLKNSVEALCRKFPEY